MKQHERTRQLRIAARISHARRIDCGINQKEMADRCGLPVKQISAIENAEREVTAHGLRLIARALDTTPEELTRPACTTCDKCNHHVKAPN